MDFPTFQNRDAEVIRTAVPITRRAIGIPQFTGSDGPHGIGNGFLGASCFPVNIAMMATWDPGLIERVGAAISLEQASRGRHRIAGPANINTWTAVDGANAITATIDSPTGIAECIEDNNNALGSLVLPTPSDSGQCRDDADFSRERCRAGKKYACKIVSSASEFRPRRFNESFC
jgi:hypothetical protein